jgi:hypothetical protein
MTWSGTKSSLRVELEGGHSATGMPAASNNSAVSFVVVVESFVARTAARSLASVITTDPGRVLGGFLCRGGDAGFFFGRLGLQVRP